MPMLRLVLLAAVFSFQMCSKSEEKKAPAAPMQPSVKPAATVDSGSPLADAGLAHADAVDAGAIVDAGTMAHGGSVDAGVAAKPGKKHKGK